VRHVLRQDLPAAERAGGGDDRGIPIGEAMRDLDLCGRGISGAQEAARTRRRPIVMKREC